MKLDTAKIVPAHRISLCRMLDGNVQYFIIPGRKEKQGVGSTINNQQQWQKFVNQTTAQMRLQLHREWRKGDP